MGGKSPILKIKPKKKSKKSTRKQSTLDQIAIKPLFKFTLESSSDDQKSKDSVSNDPNSPKSN